MKIGDPVIWRGRAYRLLGFDPMGVVDPRVHLEDAKTGARTAAPSTDIASARPGEQPSG